MNRSGRPTWVEVDLAAIRANLRALRAFLGEGVGVIAVVKADAYGHGAVPVARCLEEAGADWLAVAIPEEALELRRAGIGLPILVLNGFWPGEEAEIIRRDLTPAVYAEDMVLRLAREAARLKIPARYAVKIDTGMTPPGYSLRAGRRRGCGAAWPWSGPAARVSTPISVQPMSPAIPPTTDR